MVILWVIFFIYDSFLLEIGSFLGLLSTQYEIIPSDAFNQKELEIR